jgi:hypothetical protein
MLRMDLEMSSTIFFENSAPSMIGLAVGSLAIQSSGKRVSSSISTSRKPASRIALRYAPFSSAPERQPMYAATDRWTAAGSGHTKTMSDTISRPPGLKTRNASRKTFFLSGERLMTQFDTITSTERSAQGRFSISPKRNSTLVKPPFRAFDLAFSIISGVISTPMALPFLPSFLEARKQSSPAPEPRSRSVSPFLREANAIGFPQPRPRLASLGTALRSSFV